LSDKIDMGQVCFVREEAKDIFAVGLGLSRGSIERVHDFVPTCRVRETSKLLAIVSYLEFLSPWMMST
jgi:hypothetical protein